jgi:hypothetical protein
MRLGTHKFSLVGLCIAAAPPFLVGAALVWVRVYEPKFVEDYKDIFTPVAAMAGVIATIVSALVVASFTAEANTRNAKVKAAWDALAKKQWDKDYILARKIFVELERKKTAFSKYADRTPGKSEEFMVESEAVLNIANDYEIMAVGIEKHVLDESVIRETFRSAWIDDYKTLSPFFSVVRDDKIVIDKDGNEIVERGNGKYFEMFEKYATKWRKMKEAEDKR